MTQRAPAAVGTKLEDIDTPALVLDLDAFEKASNAELKPQKLSGTLAFMFESRYIIRPTKFAMETAELQNEYSEVWQGLKKNFPPPAE